MKILFLEDEIPYSYALMKYLTPSQPKDFMAVTNLLDFDWRLYNNPGVSAYDLVLLDLRLDATREVSIQDLFNCIPELKCCPHNSVAGISLLGLDYFQHKVLTDSTTKECAQTKFALVSGHKHLIETENLFEINHIDYPLERLLDKGIDKHAEHIRSLVEQIKKINPHIK